MSILKAAAFLTVATLVAAPAPAQETLQGKWSGEFTRRVVLNINTQLGDRGYSNYGRTFLRSELTDMARSGDRVRFRLVREAGVFVFDGEGGERNLSGTFTFTPSASYRQQLERMGFKGVTIDKLFVFAIGDLTIADVRYLDDATTDDITTTQLVRMVNHGVDVDFVKGIAAAGFTKLSTEELLRTRDHGVDPEYITAMRKHGIRLTLPDYIRAVDHGVSDDYVEEMRELGFDVDFDQLLQSRDHGVDGDFVREFASLGYKDLSMSQLVRLRDHGVDGSFARRVNRDYGRQVGIDSLIRLRDRGDY